MRCPYSCPKNIEDALADGVGLVDQQFSPAAVDALVRLHASGELVAAHAHVKPLVRLPIR